MYNLQEIKENVTDWENKIRDLKDGRIIPDSGNTFKSTLETYKRILSYTKQSYELAKSFLEMLGQGYVVDFMGHDIFSGKPEVLLCYIASNDRMMADYDWENFKSKDNIVIFSSRCDHTCYKCGTRNLKLMLNKKEKRFSLVETKYADKTGIKETAIETSCIYKDGFKPYSVELDVKSGIMLFANHFKQIYDLSESIGDRKYTQEFSINELHGRKRTSEEYAKLGLIDLNIGNCGCHMFRTSKAKDSFIVGDSGYDCDDKFRFPKTWKEVGDVCTDYWGFCIVDKNDFLNKIGKTESALKELDIDMTEIVCKPGRYRFTHRYHELEVKDDGIYTHIEWISA